MDDRLQQKLMSASPFALEGGEQAQDLLGFAAGGEGDHHVARHEDAEVAVDGFGGVQKQGRRARGTEGGGDFLGDDAALAHAGDDHAAVRFAAADDQVDGAVEAGLHRAFETAGEGFEGGCFGAHQGRGLQAVRIRRSFAIRGIHRFLMVTARGTKGPGTEGLET